MTSQFLEHFFPLLTDSRPHVFQDPFVEVDDFVICHLHLHKLFLLSRQQERCRITRCHALLALLMVLLRWVGWLGPDELHLALEGTIVRSFGV